MKIFAVTNRRTLLGILPPEVVVAGFAFLNWMLFKSFGIPLRRPWQLYEERVVGNFLFYAVALCLMPFLLRLSDISRARKNEEKISFNETLGRFKQEYLNPRRILFDLRLIHAVAIMFVVFIHLKHLIPFVNSHLFDSILRQFELRICAGKLPAACLIDFFGATTAPFWSSVYTVWYAYIGISSIILIMQRNSLLAEEYITAFVLMWFFGILLVYLFPTYGPVYVDADYFKSALPITKVTGLQEGLWQMRNYVLANPHSGKAMFMISGFPSLHFAATILCSLYLRRVSSALAIASWIFALLTLVSTLYFGWHWITDDIGSLVLVIIVMRLVDNFYRISVFSIEERPHITKIV